MTGPAPAESSPGGDQFRPDLEGLRGLAILLVLLFHAGIPGINGGFVGVDVFFVLSGFLITGLLIRERERTGRVSLPRFYARRARRILPASLVVVVATLLAATAFLPPLDLLRAADDAVAVALSVGNIRFAATAADYFAPTTPSPYLHYWSLGVEEQFYLLWPALLVLATRFGRRPRVGAGIALGVVVVASLVFAVWLTDIAAPWAFYSLPTRAWQLGLGGLLALGLDRLPREGRVPAMLGIVGWAGLAAVIAAALVIDPGTPYPGIAAVLPSLGAAAVIAAGGAGAAAAWSVGRLLAIAPMRFLGRISYSLYLVHWPILVLPAASLSVDEQLPLEVRLGLALLSVVMGALCWRIVEAPIHHSPRLRARPWRALGLSSGAIAITLVAVLAVSATTSQALDSALTAAPGGSTAPGGTAAAAAPTGSGDTPTESVPPSDAPPTDLLLPTDAGPTPTDAATATDGGASPAAPTSGPSGGGPSTPAASTSLAPSGSAGGSSPAAGVSAAPSAPSAAPSAAPSSAPASAPPATPRPGSSATPRPTAPPPITPLPRPTPIPGAQPLPANVQPPLRSAASDRERVEADGCELGNAGVQPRNCVYGNPNGAITVALVGDSHAAQWFPAINVLARRYGWRLVVYTKISCRFVDLPIYSRDLKREYTECEQWREIVVNRLQAIRPDLVIVSSARGMATMTPADDNPTRQGQAMARLLARIPGRHAIIVDTPQSHVDVPTCLSAHLNDTRPCDTLRDDALNWRHRLLETAAADADGATIIDMSNVLCTVDVCPAVLDGYIVFRDVFHLTATFSASLADELDAPIRRALGR